MPTNKIKITVPAHAPTLRLRGIVVTIYRNSYKRDDTPSEIAERFVRSRDQKLWQALDWLASTSESEIVSPIPDWLATVSIQRNTG